MAHIYTRRWRRSMHGAIEESQKKTSVAKKKEKPREKDFVTLKQDVVH